jgi:hypothetical protein
LSEFTGIGIEVFNRNGGKKHADARNIMLLEERRTGYDEA